MNEELRRRLGIEAAVTVRGDELKLWVSGDKRYLSAEDCRALAKEFARLAEVLDPKKPAPPPPVAKEKEG
jgi:hypothetical protein